MDTQYRRILIPLDGSDVAYSAISVAKVIGRIFHSELSLMTVLAESVDSRQAAGLTATASVINPGADTGGAPARAISHLEEVADELGSAGLRTSLKFQVNTDVATEIVLTARDLHSQLIVMATRGRSGVTIGLLSSVTDRVLHSSPIPVLVVPRSYDAWTPNTLVVPLDGSVLAEQALAHAESISRECEASITLIRVVPIPMTYGRDPYGGIPMDLIATGEDEAVARRYLADVTSRLRARGHRVEPHVVTGHPGVQITQLARGISGALIAITSRGSSGLTRWVIGSIADSVIRSSGVPVVVIPPSTDW